MDKQGMRSVGCHVTLVSICFFISSANSFRRTAWVRTASPFFRSQSLLHQRIASGGNRHSRRGVRLSVSIASSSANRFLLNYALLHGNDDKSANPSRSQSLLHQRIASGFSYRTRHGELQWVSIASSSANSFRHLVLLYVGAGLLSLNRFFISE